MKENKISLPKLVQRWGFILIVGGIFIIKSYDVIELINKFNDEQNALKKELIQQQKKLVKSEVGRVVKFLEIQNKQLLNNSKNLIKTRVHGALIIFNQIYQTCSKEKRPVGDIKHKIIQTIDNFSNSEKPNYFFIIDFKGNIIYHGANKKLSGKNLFANNKFSENDKKIFRESLNRVKKNGESFAHYNWAKPGSITPTEKLTYLKVFKPLNWVIGTGVFLEDVGKGLRKNIVEFVHNYRFGDNKANYIFMLRLFNINGGKNFATMLVNPNRPDLEGKYLSDDYQDAKGKYFRKEFLKGLRENGETFVKYWYKKPGKDTPIEKETFFKLTNNKKIIVAAGIYLDDINNKLASSEEELYNSIIKEIIFSTLFALVILIMFLFLIHYGIKTLKADFNLFIKFFQDAAKNYKPFDLKKIKASEFIPLAETANKMLEEKKRAEDNLRNDREKLFITIQSIGNGLITTDKDGNIQLINKSAEQLLEISSEEAIGKKSSEIFNIITENTREAIDNPIQQTLNSGTTVVKMDNVILISTSGKQYNITYNVSPIKDKNGNVLGAVLVFRNITQELRLLNKLKKQEEFNTAVINALPDIIFIFDKNYVFKNYITHSTSLLYADSKNFIDKNVNEVLPANIAKQTIEAIDNILQKQTHSLITFEYTLTIAGKEKDFEARITAMNSEEVLVIIREITQRKEIERKLIESEKRYKKLAILKKAILESPKGIIVFALDKEFCYLDFTFQHKEVMKQIWDVDIEIGKCILDYIKNDKDRQTLKENFQRALNGENFVLLEEHGDENLYRIFYEDRYNPIYNEENEIIGVAVYAIDITERIRAQQLADEMLIEVEEKAEELKEKNTELEKAKNEAEAAVKIKDDFLAQISHEIRTPLSNIVNFISLIKNEVSDIENNPILEMSFPRLHKSIVRLIRTVELIINVSEIRRKIYNPSFYTFDCKAMLNRIADEYKDVAIASKIDFSVEINCDNPNIFTDNHAFHQIIINLVDNALQYTQREGRVKVIAERTNQEIKITVIDSGKGISKEYQSNLFNAFSQEKTGYKRPYDGLGLGLFLTKEYSNLIGGKIEFESTVGKGTTFVFTLYQNN
jgi:PAS domain S-box-containing protein